MRIERLDLVRYGRFTGCALDFAAPGLHLVVGPNEAGKSTLRGSVGELLYGIHPQTKLDFVHAMQDLRIDALLRAADGSTLDVVRLKKNKDPLRTADDAVLPQGTLDGLLAGIGKEDFATVFALDHEELRAGGRALLDGKGDLGEALFESRSSARLTRVQEQLREQYKALYTMRGKSQPLNALLGPGGRVAQAKRDRESALLDPKEYQRVTDSVSDARKDLDRVKLELREGQIELNRLRRIAQAFPGLEERGRLTAERKVLLSQGDPAPGGAQDTYTELVQSRRDLAEAARGVEAELTKIGHQLDELDQQAEALGTLTGDGAASGPEYSARIDGLLEKVEELREAQRVAEIQLETAKPAAAQKALDLKKQLEAVADLAEPVDPAPLRAALKAVPEGLTAHIESTRKQLAGAEAKLQSARKRLARFALPEALEDIAVPGDAELEAILKRIATADQDLAEATRSRTEEVAREREHKRKLDGFLAQDPPPTEADLEQVRERRQGLWTRLRVSLTAQSAVQPAADSAAESSGPSKSELESQPSAELVPEYEAAVAAGDETADRMRREAQRLAERRRLELAVREAGDRIAELDDSVGQAKAAREQLDGVWGELWAASGLPVPEPDSALDLMRAHRELRELSEQVDQHRRELEHDEASARTHADRLSQLLAETGPATPVTAVGLPELRALAENRQSELADAEHERVTAAAKVTELRGETQDTERKADEITGVVRALGQHWTQLLSANGLAGSHGEVRQRLDRMLKVEEERSRLRVRKLELDSASEKAKEQRDQVDADLQRLLVECAANSEEELKAAIARGVALRRIDDNLDVVLKALTGHGARVENLEREVADWDLDRLAVEIAELERRIAEQDEVRGNRASELARLEQDLDRMNGSAAGAGKAEAVEQELAAVVGHGQEYLRLYLAERLLLANIEAYRQQHQGPVLRRAQEVFAALTDGAFTQLVDDTGPDGKAVLRARRAGAGADAGAESDGGGDGSGDGRLVGVEGMSEGTRDQLYLALRLATLERYAEEGRTMPLLLDDVLMTFDDKRAGAALQVFDDLADRFQVILLTHHTHLVDVAHGVLPDDRLHVHRVG